jgi:hypothetical protein
MGEKENEHKPDLNYLPDNKIKYDGYLDKPVPDKPVPDKSRKLTPEEREYIYATMYEMRVEGFKTRYTICKYIHSEFPHITKNWVYKLYDKMEEMLGKDLSNIRNPVYMLQESINRLEKIIEISFGRGELNSTINAIKEINKLFGLYEKHNSKLTDFSQFDEKREKINEFKIKIIENEPDKRDNGNNSIQKEL